MSIKAMPYAFVLGTALLAASPVLAQTTPAKPTKPAGAKPPPFGKAGTGKPGDKAAADKAAADKAADEKAAADKAAADKAAADKAADEKAAADKATADKAAADKAAADKAAAEAVDPNDPFEDPNKTYRFIGLRYRDAVVPQFMLNWFASGGRNVNVPMVGPVYTTRKDHVEYDLSLMYADYSMDPFLFKGKTDPDTSYELIQSQLKVFYFMMDILYEIPLETKGDKTGRFALLLGGGVGLGIVAGDLFRSQAYPLGANQDPNNPSQWGACTGPNGGTVPAAAAASFCSNPTNGHYASPTGDISHGYTEPSWFSGGSKPVIFPWIALPQISFRYKPIKQLETKLDLGFSTSGFFFGMSAAYGL